MTIRRMGTKSTTVADGLFSRPFSYKSPRSISSTFFNWWGREREREREGERERERERKNLNEPRKWLTFAHPFTHRAPAHVQTHNGMYLITERDQLVVLYLPCVLQLSCPAYFTVWQVSRVKHSVKDTSYF